MFMNKQPELLKNYRDSMKDFVSDSTKICLYARISFEIRTVGVSKREMYTTHKVGSSSPFLVAVDPRDSPVFLHGRPTQIDFDLAFTSTPFVKNVK